MSFNREKIIAEGGCYHGADNPLIECATFQATKVTYVPVSESGPAPVSIKEAADLPKRMMIEGVFQRADVRNANQRLYPRSLWERLLSPSGDVMRRIQERAMIGHLEHPTEGATDLNKGAILIVEAWMEKDGTVKGRALVYNTPEGQRIQEYIVTGTKIGISSRGTGTVDAKGVVQEDFALETWDMVYNPSTPGANPGLAATESGERTVHAQAVVETAASGGTIPRQDKPMNVAERLAQVREQVGRLSAVDPKRLTTEHAKELKADALNLRVSVAEEFSGEKRPFAEPVLKQLDVILKSVGETTMSDTTSGFVDAPAPGQTDGVGIPGNAWDVLNKGLAGINDDAQKKAAVENAAAVAKILGDNVGKLNVIRSAVEAAVAPQSGEGSVEEHLDDEAEALLAEARDEIIKLTEGEKAASAIIDELSSRVLSRDEQIESLQRENAELKAAADNSAEVIADLTSVKPAAKVSESQDAAQKATSADSAKPAKPSVAERIAATKPVVKTEEDSALPKGDVVVESQKDAEVVQGKSILEEAAPSRNALMAAGALVKMRTTGGDG